MATDVSAPLPDLTLEEKAIITVDTNDPNAVINRIVIHVSQEVPEDVSQTAPLPPLFASVPTTGS